MTVVLTADEVWVLRVSTQPGDGAAEVETGDDGLWTVETEPA